MAKLTANNLQARNLPDLLTTEQAAVLLRVSKATVRRMSVSGGIPACKVGQKQKLWRFPKRAICEKNGHSAAIKQIRQGIGKEDTL